MVPQANAEVVGILSYKLLSYNPHLNQDIMLVGQFFLLKHNRLKNLFGTPFWPQYLIPNSVSSCQQFRTEKATIMPMDFCLS